MSTLAEVLAVSRFMAEFPAPWWVAGGWAVDLWLGDVSREHEDIEISLWQSDQAQLRAYCAGWSFFTPVDHKWVPVAEGETLAFPAFQFMIQPLPGTALAEGLPAEFEFMLNYVADGAWLFRPEPTIRLPVERLLLPSPLGPNVVAPEALLLHKCRHLRPKDQHDFERALPRMSLEQRAWLRDAIAQIRPGHVWLAALDATL